MNFPRITTALGVVLVIVLGLAILSVPAAWSSKYGNLPPTQAPSPTPGKALLESFPTSIPYRYIASATEAVEMALYYDRGRATWEQPWNTDSFRTEPERITVKEFASLTEESADAGRYEGFSEDIETDAGGVWRVTITGKVQVSLFGARPDTVYDQVHYILAKRTGNLLAVITGQPIK